MKIQNTTDFSDRFLRRMVSWCCRELDLRVKKVRSINFRNRRDSFSGRCFVSAGDIICSIGRLPKYRIEEVDDADRKRLAGRGETYRDPVVIVGAFPNDPNATWNYCERDKAESNIEKWRSNRERQRIDDLVEVTAHELAHRKLYLEGSRTRKSRRYGTVSSGGSEQQTNWFMRQVVKAFQADREKLLSSWQASACKQVAEPTRPAGVELAERKMQSVEAAIKRWESKKKRAETALRKYRKQLRYYRNRVAALTSAPKPNKHGDTSTE